VQPAERSRQQIKRVYWNVRLLGLPEPLRDVWMVVLSGFLVWAIVVQGQESDRSTAALCSLRRDLEVRVAAGDQFLRDHPHGIPGIPAGTLRTSTDGQRRTINALSNLKCPPSQ
jgi:hypothetical protein